MCVFVFLGTSSILAGAALAAVYRCTGRSYDTNSLIHDVLYLEQILTTGMRDAFIPKMEHIASFLE